MAQDPNDDYAYHQLDDRSSEDDSVVSDTDIDVIADEMAQDAVATDDGDEVSLSSYNEDADEDEDDNSDVENLHHPGIDEDTE